MATSEMRLPVWHHALGGVVCSAIAVQKRSSLPSFQGHSIPAITFMKTVDGESCMHVETGAYELGKPLVKFT